MLTIQEALKKMAESTSKEVKSTIDEAAEDFATYRNNLRNDFRKYAGIDADVAITEAMITENEEAFNRVVFNSQGAEPKSVKEWLCVSENMEPEMVKEMIVEDADQIEKAVDGAVGDDKSIDTDKVEKDIKEITNKLEIDPDQVYNADGDIERNLEKALQLARREKRNNGKEWADICLVGDAGVGKTSRFWTWAAQHPEVNVLFHDAKTMDELDFKGKYINKNDPDDVKYSAVRSDEFDDLDSGEWVLFLDEFNRAKSNIRGTMLTLICDHTVPDPRAHNKARKLNGLLFTVVAVNPFNGSYNIKDNFDSAEKSRWKNVNVTQTTGQFLDYLLKTIENRLKVEKDPVERKAWAFRAQLAEKLLTDPRFHFDTPEEIEANSLSEDNVTNPRSLKRAIFASYDLRDFFDEFEGRCNPLKLKTVKAILGMFKVNDDKANQILNAHNTESDIFKD